MAIPSRVVPLNYSRASGFTKAQDDGTSNLIPASVIQSISMGIRVGTQKYAIGYVHKFTWSATREVTEVYQIEPFPNGTFSDLTSIAGTNPSFRDSSYWPGEVVELIPGKVGAVELEISRYVLYTSNILQALSAIEKIGTEEIDAIPPTSNPLATGTLSTSNYNQYVSLIQQVRSFEIEQLYVNPVTGSAIFGRVFENCWLTDLGEEIPESNENKPILENAKAKAARIRPLVLS
jgi:hypothetical protein